MDNQEIREKIIELADEKYKEFHGNLCPGTDNIIGVRVPKLRDFAKELIKQGIDVREYLENASDEYYEEILLQGMIIGLSKVTLEDFQKNLEKFIPKIDNWAVCDVTVAGLKLTKKYKKEMWEFIQKYLKSEKEYEIRFAVVMMLDFYIEDEYIDMVLEILNKITHTGYYVKMAVAWTISLAFIRYPEKTMKLLKDNELDDFTYNKSLQKIIESYRVEEKIKDEIREMKRK